MKRIGLFLTCLFILSAALCGGASAESKTLAFPGAEGGGKYSEGARAFSGVSVYHVTTLADSGDGSFRDAVSEPARIVVFDVGGVIELRSQVRMSNGLTVLGQTAPGDGIVITGYDVIVGSDNIIRYLRIRPTSKNTDREHDGLGGSGSDVIVDHCSVSWGIDELLTLYMGSNVTVQNTISSESLRMSSHEKGAHGYGGIFGGVENCSLHHNLFAHHDSRTPRLHRCLTRADVRNNVIYDWGKTNSAYGAEPYSNSPNDSQGPFSVNWINNYYKYGPGTAAGIRNRIFDVSGSTAESYENMTRFCFKGNHVYGYPNVTADNILGLKTPQNGVMVDEPADMGDYEINTQTAEEAYKTVLETVGASLPRRDAVDARIINDVKNGTGRIINSAEEVGGVPEFKQERRVFSIPQKWKDANGMGTARETDRVSSGGYTWIEAYVNDMTETISASKPSNPVITVSGPKINTTDGAAENWTTAVSGEPFEYNVKASPEKSGDPEIDYIEIYDGDKVYTVSVGDSANLSMDLSPGTHYLSARAYNKKGESTQSPTAIVYVKSAETPEGFTHAQIGNTPYGAAGGSWKSGENYTIFGSGYLGTTNGSEITGVSQDSCDFMYKEISGDFDMTVKLLKMPSADNGSSAGLMVREGLEPGARMVMAADGWLKYGENVRIMSRSIKDTLSTVTWFGDIKNNSGYSTGKYPLPKYMRIQREDDKIMVSVSNGGRIWTDNMRQPQTVMLSDLSDSVYVGIAADSGQPITPPVKEYMSESLFSNLEIKSTAPTPIPTATPVPIHAVNVSDKIQNGNIGISQKEAETGSLVQFSAVPDFGYFTDNVTVTAADGRDIYVTREDMSCAFIMPDSDVEISASFLPEGSATSAPKPKPKYKVKTSVPGGGGILRISADGGVYEAISETFNGDTITDKDFRLIGGDTYRLCSERDLGTITFRGRWEVDNTEVEGSALKIIDALDGFFLNSNTKPSERVSGGVALFSPTISATVNMNVYSSSTTNRNFFVFDITDDKYVLEDAAMSYGAITPFSFDCEAGHEYYIAFKNGYFGFTDLTMSSGADVTVDDNVNILAVPGSGFKTKSVSLSIPWIALSKRSENEYSFKMFGSDVTVSAEFESTATPTSAPTPTAVPTPTPYVQPPITAEAKEIVSGGLISNSSRYSWNGEEEELYRKIFGNPLEERFTSNFIDMQSANKRIDWNVYVPASGRYKLHILGNEYADRYYTAVMDGEETAEPDVLKPSKMALRNDDPGNSKHTALTVTDYYFFDDIMPGVHTVSIIAHSDGKSRNFCAAALVRYGGDEPPIVVTQPPEPTPTDEPEPDKAYRIASAESVSGSTNVTVEGGAEDAALIAAKYDADGVLRDFKVLDIHGAGTYKLDGFTASGGESAKIFIWNTADGMRPLSDPYGIKN